jgi:hypothetical protein
MEMVAAMIVPCQSGLLRISVIVQTTTTLTKSVNYGQSFANFSIPFPLGASFANVGNDHCVGYSSTTQMYISDDALASGSNRLLNGTLNGSVLDFEADMPNGVIVACSSNAGAATINLAY